MESDPRVERHYASTGIAGRILAALRDAQGADAPVTPEALAPLDHFHGRGVAATQELMALLTPQPGERILDIGCGIGGPARWIAAKFGVHVTGVDLTAEFCAAAEALNEATGLAGRVHILNGSALDLPLPDTSFDRAYSQNAIMNIADKTLFCREAFRVLRPGGAFALACACAGPRHREVGGEPHFPVPWATTPEQSFLATADAMRAAVEAAGFAIVSLRESAGAPPAPAQPQPGERRPVLGIQVLMGERIREMMVNTARNAAEGRVTTVEALLRKPA